MSFSISYVLSRACLGKFSVVKVCVILNGAQKTFLHAPRHTRPGKLQGGLDSAKTIGFCELSITQSSKNRSDLRKNGLVIEVLSLCLSRACLGKKIVLYTNGSERPFSLTH